MVSTADLDSADIGSNPVVPALCGCLSMVGKPSDTRLMQVRFLPSVLYTAVAQWIRAIGFYPIGWGFESSQQ